MAGFFTTVFKHSFWLVIIVVMLILGAVSTCTGDLEYKWQRSRIRSAISDQDTQLVTDRLHDYFIDDYNANPHQVPKKMGAIAEEAVELCVRHDDLDNAAKIYREYKEGMSSYARKEYSYLDNSEEK